MLVNVIDIADDPVGIMRSAFAALRSGGGRFIFNLSGFNTYNYSLTGNSMLDNEFYRPLFLASLQVFHQ